MKFKFRADKHDWMMFGIFAAVLLYFVAIAVVNLGTFASEGHLSGINPFPAFSPRYIGPTILLYILLLGGLFLSVSSYFFEREKGIGITTEKKDKGYSRWAKEKEIQEELERVDIHQRNAKAAGLPLILKENEMWVDNGEYHSLIIGATGSGKTEGFVLPQVHSLAKARESIIITDPKGEIYEKTSLMLRDRGYQILLLNFRDPQNGSAWNPMTLPYKMWKNGNHDKAIELLDDLALNILYDESNKNADPFWEKTSADYFSGIALGLFEDAKPDEININSISLATTVGEEKFGGSTYIKEYFDAKDPASAAAINASSTIMAPTETKGSILSVFKQKVKLFASRDNLSEMLSYSSVDLESIGEKPTAVFIVIQDEKKTYHSLVTILLKQIYETLISTAQKHGGKLPVRTNFILDEFANMPPLKDVTTMITAARSRRVRFTMIIQNFAQLDSVYGKDDAETIRGNCGNIVYLITTELKALEEISKMCGEVKSKKDDKTASTPLVTVSDLQRMKQFETIILRMRKQPFKTKLTPNFKIDWGRKYPLAKYPQRPKHEVHTFDIKKFVKDQKKKKLLEMMNSAGDDTAPLGGSFQPEEKVKDFQFSETTNERRPIGRGMSTFAPNNYSEPEENPLKSSYANINKEVKEVPFNNNLPKEPVRSFEPIEDFSSLPKKAPESIKEPNPNYNQDDDFGFDVDELVKKIDAKIAELEEEERREKETEAAKAKIAETPVVDLNSSKTDALDIASNKIEVLDNKEITNNILDTNDNAIPEIAKEPQSFPTTAPAINIPDDDDDEFFDDFFDN